MGQEQQLYQRNHIACHLHIYNPLTFGVSFCIQKLCSHLFVLFCIQTQSWKENRIQNHENLGGRVLVDFRTKPCYILLPAQTFSIKSKCKRRLSGGMKMHLNQQDKVNRIKNKIKQNEPNGIKIPVDILKLSTRFKSSCGTICRAKTYSGVTLCSFHH